MSGYDSLEDVWRWACPDCEGYIARSWSPDMLERSVENHEAYVHLIPRPAHDRETLYAAIRRNVARAANAS